jgi:3-oxoacyl-(acyl-carrier-protein) synthase
MMPMDTLGLLSPDGKCFTFDHRANGYGRGEGVGVVVLKRLSDAIKANDTIRAVIRGSRVNHDGRTPGMFRRQQLHTDAQRLINLATGITMPGKDAQAQNIRELYKLASLDPNQTGYVECHGTGTKAGDPTELTAIFESLCKERSADKPLLVGSIKTNIGHLEGAAGVAGLIKSILVLEKGMIPPNTNFEKASSSIHFDEWKLKVSRQHLRLDSFLVSLRLTYVFSRSLSKWNRGPSMGRVGSASTASVLVERTLTSSWMRPAGIWQAVGWTATILQSLTTPATRDLV